MTSMAVDRDLAVPMRDGARRFANLYTPTAKGPHPVILSVTPYGKDNLPDLVGSFFMRLSGVKFGKFNCSRLTGFESPDPVYWTQEGNMTHLWLSHSANPAPPKSHFATSKSIVITGASSGIGRATELRLARKGWRVFAARRKESDAQAIQRETGETLGTFLLDVMDSESIGLGS